MMLLLRKAHLGEVSAWPQILNEMYAGRNIDVLE
jgi:asparagine synthetase A